MKNYKNKLLLLFFLGGGLFISCKKGAAEDKIILADSPVKPDNGAGIYIPAKLTTGKSETVFSYSANNLLTKINYGNGDSTILKFDVAGKLTRLNRYRNGALVSVSYYTLDEVGIIKEIEQVTVDPFGSRNAKAYLKLSYNSDGKLNLASYYAFEGTLLLYTQQYSYSTTGNLLAQTSTEASLKANYLYDTKNALFKNVTNAWLFALEKENDLFLSVLNNIQTCSYPSNTAGNATISYVYNTANFPKTINYTVKGVTANTMVTYK